MNRRNMMSAFGATAIALTATTAHKAQAEDDHKEKEKHSELHERCANACYECARMCSKGFNFCHSKVVAGMKGYAKSATLCNDCAEICITAAKLVDHRSPLMGYTCHACAESCEATIAECEKLNDQDMNAVVESLRKCARLCRNMAKEKGHHEDHHDDDKKEHHHDEKKERRRDEKKERHHDDEKK